MGIFVFAFVVILAIVAGLARGPVSLGFIAPYVEQTLDDQYQDLNLDFTGLELEWNSRDKNLVVAVDDLVVYKAERRVATIPDVSVKFSAQALLRGLIAPSELEFTGMTIRMTRTKDDTIRFGYEYALMNEGGQQEAKSAESEELDESSKEAILQILEELSGNRDQETITGYLERVELYNSTIFIEDEVSEKFWQARNVDLFLWRGKDGLHGQANGDLRIGQETVELIVLADYDRTTKQTQIDGQINSLPLFLLAEKIPDLKILEGAKIVASGRLDLLLDADFQPGDLGFDIQADAGSVDLPELYKQPFEIETATVSGSLSSDFTVLTLDKVAVETLGASVNAAGEIAFGDDGFGLKVSGNLANLQVNDLDRFWPYSMAEEGFDWVTTRIRDGKVSKGEFTINLPAGALDTGELPEGAVRLSFDMEGVSANYYPPLPKVTDITGSAVLTEKDIGITNMTGKLGNLAVTSDRVLIYDFDKYDQLADIRINVKGSSKEIYSFLDLEPLGFATPYGITPAEMTGQGDVNAEFNFPLRHDLTIEKVKYKAQGQFTNASIPDIAAGVDLSKGDLEVVVDPKGLEVEGTAELNGVPFKIDAQSWFTGKRTGDRLYELVGTVDNEGRKLLEIETDFVDGPVKVIANINTRPDGSAYGNFSADVTEAQVAMSALHWQKDKGVAGKVSADVASSVENVTNLTNLVANLGDLTANGTARLIDNQIRSISAPVVRYGENDFGFEFRQDTEGNMSVDVKGNQFDLKPFVVATYDLNEAGVDGSATDNKIAIEVDIKTLLLDQNISVGNVRASLNIDGNLITNGKMKGQLAAEKFVNMEIRKEGSGRKVTFITNDAGSLFAGFDIYDNLRDGTLKLNATIDDTKPNRPAEGTVDMKEVRVVNAPVLAKILSFGSLGGIVDVLRGEGLIFATVEGPFTYDNGVVTTRDFRAVGSIGITVNGTVDQPNNDIDIFGTVIPSYTLNSVLGNIPIIGTLLVGKKGEGIFGFSYKVKGGLDDPQASVNAVSALAPGILRRMFFEPWDQIDVEPPDPYANKGEGPGN